MSVTDIFNRPIRDLRISITDRCNFRCTYCMPSEVYGPDFPFQDRKELLNFEEIERVVKIFVKLGVKKIRLTGGEPLLRRDCERLVSLISKIDAIEDIAITTNGVLLPKKIEALKAAGLNRVTISLDALDNKIFKAMNDRNVPVEKVLDGIVATRAVGIPVKLNMVVQKGVNDSQILPMANFARKNNITLRFIEYMDVGSTNDWDRKYVVPSEEIVKVLSKESRLERLDPLYKGEVAKRYRYVDSNNEIGFISSVTQPFCGDCSRVRLSSDGKIYTCLFGTKGFELKKLLRENSNDKDILEAIKSLWKGRNDRYSELRGENNNNDDDNNNGKVEMPYIGG